MDTTKTFACALVALLLGASACSTGDETGGQTARLSARIAELESDSTGYEDQIAGLSARIAELEADSTGYKGQIARLSARIAELEYEIADIDSAFALNMNRCIDDVLNEIGSTLRYGRTDSAGRHYHWYEGDTVSGHTHDILGWMTLSTPQSC